MMKTFIRWGAAALLVGSASAAGAVPYSASDTVDPAQLGVIRSAFGGTAGQNYSFTHDLTDNGYTVGHTVLSAFLTLTLTDSDGISGPPSPGEGGSEWSNIRFDLGNILNFTQQVQSPDVFLFNFVTGEIFNSASLVGTNANLLSVMSDIQADGKLTVTLSALQQSQGQVSGYFFERSVLDITADNGIQAPVPTPEPGAVALLGLGVAAVHIGRRRKKA